MEGVMGIARATVFGGSGFVGRHVVRELAKSGASVRVAVRRPDRALFLKTMGDVGQITPVAANIRDDTSVADAVRGSDAVVNLVGILHQSGRRTFEAIHHHGAGRIARAAHAAGARSLVHVSAIGADAASPSAYGRSKAAGEAAVREAFPSAAIVRPSLVFGADDNFFNRFAMLARISPALPLIGGGKTRFQPVYVGDVAAAIAALAAAGGDTPATYELGGPEVLTFRELMEVVLAATGRRRLLVPVPFGIMELNGAILGLAPEPQLTRDQVLMLRADTVAEHGLPGLAELGITPSAVAAIVPGYLVRYRRGGEFARPSGAA
jgi:NADH dehydrogenase